MNPLGSMYNPNFDLVRDLPILSNVVFVNMPAVTKPSEQRFCINALYCQIGNAAQLDSLL